MQFVEPVSSMSSKDDGERYSRSSGRVLHAVYEQCFTQELVTKQYPMVNLFLKPVCKSSCPQHVSPIWPLDNDELINSERNSAPAFPGVPHHLGHEFADCGPKQSFRARGIRTKSVHGSVLPLNFGWQRRHR